MELRMSPIAKTGYLWEMAYPRALGVE